MQFWSQEIEKQVGERVQLVLSDPMLLSVFQRFGHEVLRRSSVFHGLRRFLLENEIRGARCFEIGTWNGLTACVLSDYFREVVSVDVHPTKLKHQVVQHLAIPNIRFVDVADNARKAEVAASVDFDFAYIDGNHVDDTEADFEMVKKCKRVLFHEVWPFQEPVWRLVHSLPSDEVIHGGYGLALWIAK